MKVSSPILQALLILVSLILCSHANNSDAESPFPPNFLFGAASSAYQYEGAYLTDGKGLSNWDVFTRKPGVVEDGSNGDVSIDFYHRYPEIIDLMVSVGLDSFQFSISWARILPKGKFGEINTAGIDYYNKLIDTLLSNGIEPFVILHHFDFPVELEKRYKSWLSPESVEDFKYFADICFQNFGDRIKYWVTFSEPNTMVLFEYELGQYPPGHCSVPTGDCKGGDPEEAYIAAHNIILAHAATVKMYKSKYQKQQGGQIGMVVETMWFEPLTNTTEDKLAAEIAQSFVSNWFLDPVVFGRYPKEMTDILGDSLPKFSTNDVKDLKMGIDFLGVNHYTSFYVMDCVNKSCEFPSSKMFGYVGLSENKNGIPIGEKTGMNLYVYPKGMEKILNYFKERVNNIPMYVTENGYCEIWDSGITVEDSLNDTKRVKFLTDYLGAVAASIRGGADVRGYFLWNLVDAFEWNFGYKKRYGIHHFDFETKKITPKSSAAWYKLFIEKHKTTQLIVWKTNPQLLQAQ